MVSYLQVENLTKSFGDLLLFHDLSFGIAEGDRIGLIAKNGSGKTTLLNILSGKEDYDSGNITFRNGLRVGYLEQMPEYPPHLTVIEACFYSSNETVQLISEYEQALQSGDQEKIQSLIDRMDHLNAWDYEQRAKQILSQLKIHKFDQPISQLSGGQIKRLALANVLITEPDLLILDEPTNHLDIASREWIEDALSDYTQALLFVSHDRYFIEKFASRIWLLENGTITDYRGTYEEFRAYRARQTALQQTVKAVEREKKPKPKRAPNTARQRERTERDIEKLEAQLAALDAESEANATDYQKLMELDAQKQTLNTQLEALYAAWEALCD